MGWLTSFAAELWANLAEFWLSIWTGFVSVVQWFSDKFDAVLAWLLVAMQTAYLWIADVLGAIFGAIVLMLSDVVLFMIERVFELVTMIVLSIPMPDFLTTYSMESILAGTGPTVTWILGSANIGACFTAIAAGYGFRLLRKLFTLGQW